MDNYVEPVKQYPGQQQVDRAVEVSVPGKHFPGMTSTEQAAFYPGSAVEYKKRHKFERHAKAWGAAHTGPGIRFICNSDAIDDPNTNGFWTMLLLWNKWRHETYKDDREAEKQYLDELPGGAAAAAAAPNAPTRGAKAEKAPPEIKQHFDVVGTGMHTFGGTGRLSGTTAPFTLFACKKVGCARDARKPIKQVGSATARPTGQLFGHLEVCQPQVCVRLRAASKHSSVEIDDDGNEYVLYSFEELLPHHALYVEKCFRSLDHFYETRAGNGLVEYVRSFDRRAGLPHYDTCIQLLEVYEELYDEKIFTLIDRHKRAFGAPCAGSTTDVWSMSSCRDSFGCMRAALCLDGDMVAQECLANLGPEAAAALKGTLVDVSPVLAFSRFSETHHTGACLARWKSKELKVWGLESAIGLATEDGASPNKKANKILGQDMKVCLPHDVARCVLLGSGEDGTPCRNPELKALTARSSKQSASFSRSVVANKALQQAQLDADADLKESQTLATKLKNKTRWTGLFSMYQRNRLIGPEIRTALTGDENGECDETPAVPRIAVRSDEDNNSESEDDGAHSDGDDQEEANRAAKKEFPSRTAASR